MDALVVVESVFGNTRRVAEAIADGLGQRVHARVVGLAEMDSAELARLAGAADLLVVGGPTHMFGMSRPATRRAAAEQAGAGAAAAAVGLREWLAALGPAPRGRLAAAFDTQAARGLTGSAAAGAARRLRRLGYGLITRPASFRVDGTTGPLLAGELERARLWGSALVTRIVADAAMASGR